MRVHAIRKEDILTLHELDKDDNIIQPLTKQQLNMMYILDMNLNADDGSIIFNLGGRPQLDTMVGIIHTHKISKEKFLGIDYSRKNSVVTLRHLQTQETVDFPTATFLDYFVID